ncbi:DUF2911 domain-containing protein [Hydrotalea sp.]|uniref:DUF2911 domain-containing protein n=1 Tax=Hydrotalea sp. TaxID=2881279 RepID=UPI00262AAED6|nr:DUF2911 domain-containing protein [Hydrotalea sp.]
MKKVIFFAALFTTVFISFQAFAQDKSKRPSPPATVTATTHNGVTIQIDYSQPAVKGRTIGKDIAPYGEVWRTGANEATVFQVNKDVTIDGKSLKAGKYSLYSIPGANEWTIILNKSWNQWGTVYNKKDDVMRFQAKPLQHAFTERMTFTISPSGEVGLLWGNIQIGFMVK